MLKYDIKSQQFIKAELTPNESQITALYARLSSDDEKEGDARGTVLSPINGIYLLNMP